MRDVMSGRSPIPGVLTILFLVGAGIWTAWKYALQMRSLRRLTRWPLTIGHVTGIETERQSHRGASWDIVLVHYTYTVEGKEFEGCFNPEITGVAPEANYEVEVHYDPKRPARSVVAEQFRVREESSASHGNRSRRMV